MIISDSGIKRWLKNTIAAVLLSVFTIQGVYADDSGSAELSVYFKAYAQYIGINVTKDDSGPGVIAPADPQLPLPSMGASLGFLIENPTVGALWVDFQTASNGQSVSANPLIDVGGTGESYQPSSAKGYAITPVRQEILNLLGRGLEDYQQQLNSCSTSDTDTFGCQPPLNRVIGSIDKLTGGEYTLETVLRPSEQVVEQLNADSLVAPIEYQIPTEQTSTSSEVSSTSSYDYGLQSIIPAVNAQNFIRYVSYAVNPIYLTSSRASTITSWLSAASDTSTGCTAENARTQLSQYLVDARYYAAQMSVGVSNLYHLLAKRLPSDKNLNANGEAQSQNQAEYTMSTHRILNSDDPSQLSTWHQQIQKSSLLELMRQMNYLLAEINYQLYLNRVEQERSMLAISVLQLQQAQNIRATVINDLDSPSSGYCSSSS